MINYLWGANDKQKRKPLFFYGAGVFCRHLVMLKDSTGIIPDYISDRDSSLWGGNIEGIQIISPDDMRSMGLDNPVIVTTLFAESAKKTLGDYGFTNVYMFPKKSEAPYNCANSTRIFSDNDSDIRFVLNNLSDERSVEVFNKIKEYRITNDFKLIESVYERDEYYPSGIVNLTQHEIFVDGGAYDGDTVLDFIQRTENNFNHIYALEPQPDKAQKIHEWLKYHISKDKITVINKALSDRVESVRFTGAGIGAGISADGELEVKTDFLDNMFKNCREGPTMIKLDIEGAEMAALNGAEQTISKYRPKLAVCIYHKFNDLWEIPCYLMRKYPFYSFYVRHHQLFASETVLYAVAE